jgi:hypothetical protein
MVRLSRCCICKDFTYGFRTPILLSSGTLSVWKVEQVLNVMTLLYLVVRTPMLIFHERISISVPVHPLSVFSLFTHFQKDQRQIMPRFCLCLLPLTLRGGGRGGVEKGGVAGEGGEGCSDALTS